ncbi:MAG: hypothetical protein AAB638_02960 [Patescibacteria group bacterium]
MDDIKIDLPVCNQYDESHDKNWAHRLCAICSLWTLLKFHNSGFSVPVMDLVNKALAQDSYLENVGWKHAGIVNLANEYGLKLQYAKKFFYTPEEKEQGLLIVDENIRNHHPVIISIFSHFTPARGAHMVIINGFQNFGDSTLGYYIQDSDATFRGHNYFVTRAELIQNWRGGLIYQDSLV